MEEMNRHEERHNLLNTSCLYSLDRKNYNSVLDHPDFTYLCKLIGYLKSEGDAIDTTIDSIKRVLRRMFGLDFEIAIVDNCGQPEFFGCNVFPPEDMVKAISKKIIYRGITSLDKLRHIWNHNEDWHLDLDSRMFYDTNIGLNPAEIAAIIFYNIENIAFNLRPLERTTLILQQMFATKGLLLNNLARSSLGIAVFVLPLYQACKFKSYFFEQTDTGYAQYTEGGCFVINPELSNIYKSAIQKIIIGASNDNVDVPLNKLDEDIKGVSEWVFSGISNMQYSTKMIQDTCKKLLLIEKSNYFKTILSGILMDIGDYSRKQIVHMESSIPRIQEQFSYNEKAISFRQNQYRKNAQKKIYEDCERVLKEGFLDLLDSVGNMPKVSQKEIDMINVQVQKVNNVEDKMYVLDELHSKLDIVEASLSIIESGDKEKMKKVKVSKAVLLDQKKQLDSIRDQIINRKVEDSQYSLHVIYPKGYEG